MLGPGGATVSPDGEICMQCMQLQSYTESFGIGTGRHLFVSSTEQQSEVPCEKLDLWTMRRTWAVVGGCSAPSVV